MSVCELIEVYQDVVDLKDQNLDNYKYLIPVNDGSINNLKSNRPFISDFYNKVIDEESYDKNDTHIYESLYDFSQKQFCNSNTRRQPSLPDRRLSRSEHTIKRNRNKIENDANNAKNRVPLGDCSNWTLSSTCGEQFFEKLGNNDCDKTSKEKSEIEKIDMKKEDDNNNSLFHKLKNRKKQSKPQKKLPKSNKSSNDCDVKFQPTTHLEPKEDSCKTKMQPSRNSCVFFQHKQFKKNLEEDNPNLNPIRSTDSGTGKMFKKDKDKKLKSKITNYYKKPAFKNFKGYSLFKVCSLHQILTDIKLKLERANIRKETISNFKLWCLHDFKSLN